MNRLFVYKIHVKERKRDKERGEIYTYKVGGLYFFFEGKCQRPHYILPHVYILYKFPFFFFIGFRSEDIQWQYTIVAQVPHGLGWKRNSMKSKRNTHKKEKSTEKTSICRSSLLEHTAKRRRDNQTRLSSFQSPMCCTRRNSQSEKEFFFWYFCLNKERERIVNTPLTLLPPFSCPRLGIRTV